MKRKITIRTFLKGGMLLTGGALAACAKAVSEVVDKSTPSVVVADAAETSYMPLVRRDVPTATPVPTDKPTPKPPPSKTPPPPGSKPRVVHIYAPGATNWNLSAQNYWDYVNQDVVNSMVDEGVKHLTGKTSAADAWRALLPSYSSGQVVAIKVSFNNTNHNNPEGSQGQIDGIIEPVNAIIRGLVGIGVSASSIVVFDSSRTLPPRFTGGCDYAGVKFRDENHNPWGSTKVTFTPPGVSAFTQSLSNEVANADYLINVPILKYHSMARLSLAMKNHYGTIHDPEAIHPWTSLSSDAFTVNYSPMVDINKNPQIAGKTILTVGDAIFASYRNHSNESFPRAWLTFNNQTPRSLFFATDPVAIDSVMGDVVNQEWLAAFGQPVKPDAYAYLQLSEAAGLGIFERGNPHTNTYTRIDYQRMNI